MEEAHFCLVL